jgi:hypothetical protein
LYKYAVTKITANDGTAIVPGNLTLVIGPNNVGKSRMLKELVDHLTKREVSPANVIITGAEWALPSDLAELRRSYPVERVWRGTSWSWSTLNPTLVEAYNTGGGPQWPEQYQHYVLPEQVRWFAMYFGMGLVSMLTTETRLQLVNEGPSPAEEWQTATVLQSLYNKGREVEKAIRQKVRETFSHDIILDITTPQRLRLRIGADFDWVQGDPRDYRAQLSKYERLDDQGDGIRSFVGIVAALLGVARPVFLIDEPEAFLHPPQAFRIGEFLGEQAQNGPQVIAATHSVDVLRGVLNKTTDVSIVRIDRQEDRNSFRLLAPQRLKLLSTDPLLSSARVLDGLFYSQAAVVEADADARFYHSVAKRRLPGSDTHFVNADNKQTVAKICTLYHDMGVRRVGIVDFDAVCERSEFEKQLRELQVEAADEAAALQSRDAIANSIQEEPAIKRLQAAVADVEQLGAELTQRGQAGDSPDQLLKMLESRAQRIAAKSKVWASAKRDGREALRPEAAGEFEKLQAICSKYGLFINPAGELESMLRDYGIQCTTDKRGWIRTALQLVSEIEVSDDKYPWRFVKGIQEYFAGN